MLFTSVMRLFPSGRFLISYLLSQLASIFGAFDCAEVQPEAVVCRSGVLLVYCDVWYFFL
jgi:hypothetical protein